MGFFDEHYDLPTAAEGRVEGVAKVTGGGKYAAEYKVDGLCHAVLVGSTIAAGKIKSFNLDNAKQVAGVLGIITHLEKPLVPGLADEAKIKDARFGLPVFHTDKIYFKGQPIALVIAETLEDATYAASLVTAEYKEEIKIVDFDNALRLVSLTAAGKDRGDITTLSNAAQTVEAEYNIKAEVHNPMEMHATIAEWTADDKLKLFDKNQGVNNVQRTFAKLFNIPVDNIEVISEFVGGGFGLHHGGKIG